MSIVEELRFGLRRAALSLIGGAVTHPMFSWTWSGGTETRFVGRLNEFRPPDGQSVVEMMDGKYLLGGVLIETGGQSPFALEDVPDAWFADLHSFGWLRHFRDASDIGRRRFARTLVLDWTARHARFDADAWAGFVTARRVLNWLKSYELLIEDASPDHVRAMNRTLSSQLQSLKVRAPLATAPLDALMIAIALVGAALSQREDDGELDGLVARLADLVEAQFDADGMHLSRSPFTQIQILSELIPVSELLSRRRTDISGPIAARIEAMLRAHNRLVLGTRELVYMNGCGQVPVELVLAISGQSGGRAPNSGLIDGYGVLIDGEGKLVADSGKVPPVAFAENAHAGALSFEFSSGSTLIVGNCGPAPAQLPESRNMFRHSSAHSAPTIDDASSARVGGGGWLDDRVRQRGSAPVIGFHGEDNSIEMQTSAYRDRYGLDIVRRLTLMGGGHALVGQDRLVAAGRTSSQRGELSIRFHLAPGVAPERNGAEDLIRMIHRNGEVWTFLWEGGYADIEDSVRHSAHFGLHRTRQIVLSSAAEADREVAWVFTRQ